MKKTITAIVSLAIVLACSREASPVLETLGVSHDKSDTKVQLVSDVTVWNAGDEISVFYNGSDNECWEYSGTDKAAAGSITHLGLSSRSETDPKTALYPYSAGASYTGGVLSSSIPATQNYVAGSYGYAVMTSVSTTDILQFKYASAFIALELSGLGTVKKAVLSGYDDETLAGEVSIDVNGTDPVMTLKSGASAKEITVLSSSGDNMLPLSKTRPSYLWFCIPPMTFTSGFKITLTYTSGNTRECRYTMPVSIGRGEALRFTDSVLDVGSVIGKKEILLDFRSGNNPFTEAVVTTSTHHYRESIDPVEPQGDFPDGKSAFTTDGNYEFAIYTHYGLGGDGKPSYGIGYNSLKNYVTFGRSGSYIRTPALPGHCLYSATYEAGSTAGTPCFSSTPDGTNVVSERVGSTVDGGVYTFTLFEPEANTSYYLMVNSGNLTFRYMKFIFLPE